MNRFFSQRRLLNYGVVELPKDITGQVDGPHYQPFLGHSETRQYKNVLNGINGIWCGRTLELASEDEANAFFVLEGQSSILSIREGFLIASDQVLQDVRDGKELFRNQVMTIDFVCTRPPRNSWEPLRYLGLSSKPAFMTTRPDIQRRANREKVALELLGWQWDFVRKPSDIAVANHKRLRNWAKPFPIDDAHPDALQLAALFYRTTSTKNLRELLAILGKRLGIGEANQFFVFAAAYYFGYVQIDHRFVLDEDLPLVLKSPAHSTRSWL